MGPVRARLRCSALPLPPLRTGPLLTNIRKSLGLSVLDTYSSVFMQLVGTVVMARLLTPEEVGTYAIAAVFISIAGSMRHFGVPEILIQERDPTPDFLRAALAVSMIVSFSFGVLLNLIAPLVASFYRHPEVATVMHVLSITFFVTPFAAVTLSIFRRELRMGPTFLNNISNNVVILVLGIVLAIEGLGALSLAWANVAGALVALAITLWFRPADVPMRPSLRGIGRVFSMGKHVSGVYLFGQMGASAPEAIIGRADGVASVAFFSRAGGLIELFNKLVLYSVWPVVVPVFAQRAREAGGVQGTYLTGTLYLTGIAWPILFLMGLLAFPAVRIFYGAQWVTSAPLAQVLCIAAAVGVSYHLTKDTLIAIGRVKECNYLQIKVHLLRVAGILLVIPFGLDGAAWGIVAGSLISSVITHRALHAATGLGLRHVIAALFPSLHAATLCVLPAWALTALFPPDERNYLWVGLGATAASVAAWAWLMRRAGHPLWGEVENLSRRFRRNRPATR